MSQYPESLPGTASAQPSVRWQNWTGLLKIIEVAMIVTLATAFIGLQSARGAENQSRQIVDGMAVYVGVLPAEMIEGHPADHPEVTMHGGVPSRRHTYHVLVAIFDSVSGQRIADATVRARVSEFGLGGIVQILEPMQIEGTITFGGFFDFPSRARYVIHLDITRPSTKPVTVDFSYDHEPP